MAGSTRYEPTISLGNILTIVGLVIGLWGASNRVIASFEARMTKIEVRLDPLWADYVKERNSP